MPLRIEGNRPQPRLLPTGRPARRLLIDVSVLIQNDAGTGIQRVVRMLAQRICGRTFGDCVVQAVYATRSQGFNLLTDHCLAASGECEDQSLQLPLDLRNGDIFLGLDLSPKLIVRHGAQLLAWRAAGVKLAFVVYDLLPITNPGWFSIQGSFAFRRWFGFISKNADQLICISQDVARQVQHRLLPRSNVEVSLLPMGDDPIDQLSTLDSAIISETLEWMAERPTILMVSTIEPRKGHASLIGACRWMWKNQPNCAPNLLCVGKPGWKVKRLQLEISRLAITEPKFRWITGAGDAELGAYYRACSGLVMPSHGEGFGLPIVEALACGARVLARDIPVFREIKHDRLVYFTSDNAQDFGMAILKWLEQAVAFDGNDRTKEPHHSITWDMSSESLLRSLHLQSAPTA